MDRGLRLVLRKFLHPRRIHLERLRTTCSTAKDMYVRRRDALVEVAAPAKVNLFLEILARRSDGFHELEMLVSPITRFDSVSMSIDPSGRVQVDCRWAHGLAGHPKYPQSERSHVWGPLPQGEDNLVTHALSQLREAAGTSMGARVSIIKRIPASAGLGGASSDAAAALLAANEIWRLRWSTEQLAELAAGVGSDVPLFLYGGACVCRGRGELVQPCGGFPGLHLVVARPPEGLSTGSVYQQCVPAVHPRSFNSAVHSIRARTAWNQVLFNRLQTAAEGMSEGVRRLRGWFEKEDVLGHQMSGSGTSYFGICRHARHARQVAGRLRAEGLGEVFTARTGGRPLPDNGFSGRTGGPGRGA
jgi:4-diphosphocytidyl-2-C-methyl-D-erythritol kinase